MPLPVAHGLIGAGIGALAPGKLTWQRTLLSMVVGGLIAAIPDIDLVVAWGMGGGVSAHGSYTHSILFAVGLGAAVALLMRPVTWRGAAVFIAAVLSHGLLDCLTKDEFGGAALFWPFSRVVWNLGLLANYEFFPNPARQSWREIALDALPFCLHELRVYGAFPVAVLIWRSRRQCAEMLSLLSRRLRPKPTNCEEQGGK